MRRIVLKFGGSSVRDAEHLRNAAAIIGDTYQKGSQVVVVLSAQGDTTDELIVKAEEIAEAPSKREMDLLLSAGEQMSIALCAMALKDMGLPAVSLTAWQVGIHTTDAHGGAHIRRIDTERIQQELDRGKIVLVAGFQGVDDHGDVTTLGRGGSDTSAVALAAVLHADLCRIYTDVDGVFTADPRLVPEARKLPEITYDEMLELSRQGAQVLHDRSVKLAKKYHVGLEVLSSLKKKPGTRVGETVTGEKADIIGAAKDTDIARIVIKKLKMDQDVVVFLFDRLKQAGIRWDMLLQFISADGTMDVRFIVPYADAKRCTVLLEEVREELGFQSVMSAEERLAKVSIIGTGVHLDPSTVSKLLEALYDADINVQMISADDLRISVLVDADDGDTAVRAVHRAFFEKRRDL